MDFSCIDMPRRCTTVLAVLRQRHRCIRRAPVQSLSDYYRSYRELSNFLPLADYAVPS